MAQMPLGGGAPSRMTLAQVFAAAAEAAPIFDRALWLERCRVRREAEYVVGPRPGSFARSRACACAASW